jgi:hypothetical protein
VRDAEPFIFDYTVPKEVSGAANALTDANSIGGVGPKKGQSEMDQLAWRFAKESSAN